MQEDSSVDRNESANEQPNAEDAVATETTPQSSASLTDDQKKELIEKRRAEMMKQRELALERQKQHLLGVLMGQTTWDEGTAKQMLEEHKYNVQECVRVFMGMPAKKAVVEKPTTINQGIYSNIRGMMDDASRRHQVKQRMEAQLEILKQKRQEYIEKMTNSKDTPQEDGQSQ